MNYRYCCLNQIAEVGLNRFKENFEQVDDLAEADAALVRSAKLDETQLGDRLLAIGRAGAGVNNIPVAACSEKGIVVFNTPGANANGVKELVLAGMILASRDVVGGITWTKEHEDDPEIDKLAEKEKKRFVGSEINGKKLGIIGLGAIGQQVANAAVPLGMEVYGFDPFISVDAAWNLSRAVHHVENAREIFETCDYITIHVPLTESTKGMIGAAQIAQMKEGVILLNFARDLLVDEESLVKALEEGRVRKYVTDFANPTIMGVENVLAIPHLGASTKESEDNCAIHAVREVRDYLNHGNIRNSVNFPDCDMGKCQSAGRVSIIHRNVASMIAKFTSIIGDLGVNITDMVNKSRGEYAYTMLDIESPMTDEMLEAFRAIDGVLRVRIVK